MTTRRGPCTPSASTRRSRGPDGSCWSRAQGTTMRSGGCGRRSRDGSSRWPMLLSGMGRRFAERRFRQQVTPGDFTRRMRPFSSVGRTFTAAENEVAGSSLHAPSSPAPLRPSFDRTVSVFRVSVWGGVSLARSPSSCQVRRARRSSHRRARNTHRNTARPGSRGDGDRGAHAKRVRLLGADDWPIPSRWHHGRVATTPRR